MTLSRKSEFSQLFEEFRDTFATTPEGQEYGTFYVRDRTSGQRNFVEVQAAFQQLNITGPEQVTDELADQLVKKLLPHPNSMTHREQGYWIHYTSASTDDIQAGYEENGSEWDWKRVAYGIYQWLTACVAHPEKLQHYCDEFLALDCVSGVQSEMLTPILNALNPDAFLLINSKSQQVLAYFSDTQCSSNLSNYPEVNHKGHKLIIQLTPLMQEITRLTPLMRGIWQSPLSPADQFDMFCYWLISLKKYSFSSHSRYWRMRVAFDRKGHNLWQRWQENGFISLIDDEIGDISTLSQQEYNDRKKQNTY